MRPATPPAALTAVHPVPGDPVTPDAAWRRPAPPLRQLRLAEVGGLAVVALVVVVVAGHSSAAGLTGGLIGVAVLGAAAAWVALRRVAAWGYAERDDDLVIRRGVFIRRLSVIPYGRMQFVDVTAGPLERMFGLATVRMHTAAAASDVRVPGLDARQAAELRDRLTELGEARAAGL